MARFWACALVVLGLMVTLMVTSDEPPKKPVACAVNADCGELYLICDRGRCRAWEEFMREELSGG